MRIPVDERGYQGSYVQGQEHERLDETFPSTRCRSDLECSGTENEHWSLNAILRTNWQDNLISLISTIFLITLNMLN